MRSVAAGAITVLACGAVAVLAGPAHAQDRTDACLVINNRAADYFNTILIEPVEVPDVKWQAFPWSEALIELRDKPLKTPTGEFNVTVVSDVPVYKAWKYYPRRNTAVGCNGSWVLTLTEGS